MITQHRLFLLLSLASDDDSKWWESWDDEWDFLYAHDYIKLDDDEVPSLTDKGERAIQLAVKGAEVAK